MIMAALVVLFHTTGFLSSIHSIMSTRTSQGAIAWAVSLNTFPYLAVPAYWILGRSKFEGYVIARRSKDAANDAIEREVIGSLEPFIGHEPEQTEAVRAGEALAGMPVLSGNRVDLLIDGDATFESILEGIDQAQSYVLVQFYIVRDDGLGRALKAVSYTHLTLPTS